MTEPSKMIAFIDSEIRSLRGRIGARGNAVQEAKLIMLKDLRDYVLSTSSRALERRQSA